MGRLKRSSKRKTSKKRSPSAYNYEQNIQERLNGSKYKFKTFASKKMARPVVKSLYNSEYDNNFNIEGESVLTYRYSV